MKRSRQWILALALLTVAVIFPHGRTLAQDDPVLGAGTYFGGSDLDGWYDVPVVEAPDGTIYVAGSTRSSNLPVTVGAYDETANGNWDIFVAHFDAGMSQLLQATFIGGTGGDAAWPGVDLLLASDGGLYVTSTTNSSDYPTTEGAFSTTLTGSFDIIITKLNADLSQVEASTYLGGTGVEDYPKLAQLPGGDILVTCCTNSNNFPTTAGAFRETLRGGKDLAVARFTGDLTTMVAGTYLGSSGNDWPEAIVRFGDDEVFLTGWTTSRYFPTTDGAFMETASGGTYQAFVSCLSSDLSSLVASTYISGNSWEFGYGLELDEEGKVFACGHTASTDFPVPATGAQTSYAGSGGAGSGDDIWVARFSHDLAVLEAATYLGGSGWENGVELAVIPGGIIVGGTTSSLDFPVTAGAFSTQPNGGSSTFTRSIALTRLDRDLTVIEASTFLGGNGSDNVGGLVFSAAGTLIIAGSTNSYDFPVGNAAYDATFSGGSFEYGGDIVIARLGIDLSGEFTSTVGETPPPERLQLHGAIPNPFNPRTEVAFSVAKPSLVKVAVHDLAGRHVATLANREFSAGIHRVAWQGRNAAGQAVSSGTYLVRVTSGRDMQSSKLMLEK